MTGAVHDSLEKVEERTLGLLPDKRIAALLLDETQLAECLRGEQC